MKNQRAHPVWVRRGERHGDEAAISGCEDHGSLGAGLVQNRPQVVDQRLDRRNIPRGEALRAPQPATVGGDETAEAGERANEANVPWVLPVEDDVREVALEVDEIHGPLADDLEGEEILAVLRITRLGTLHARIVAHRAPAEQALR